MSSYPTLEHLFGVYINEDWPDDYGTVWAAIDDFVRDEPELAELATAEVRELLSRGLSEGELKRVLDNLSCNYWPYGRGSNYLEWLARVAEQLAAAIERPITAARPDAGHVVSDATGTATAGNHRCQADEATFGDAQGP